MKLFNYTFKDKNNLKILVLSDIHYYNQKEDKKLKEIIKHLENNHYDVILLAGDIIDTIRVLNDDVATAKIIDFFQKLSEYAPTYTTFASHDMAYFDVNKKQLVFKPEIFSNKLENKLKKIKNLYLEENKTYNLSNNITLTIIEPLLKYKEDNNKVVKNYEFLKQLNKNKTNLLLCHYPDFAKLLYQNGYLEKIKLVISGHNHNGMTQLKFLPLEGFYNLIDQKNRGIITPEKTFNLKATKEIRGLVKLDEKSQIMINPAFTSLAHCTGFLNHFDNLFYNGATVIEFKK